MSALLVRGIGTLCTCDPSRGPAPGIIEAAALVAREREIVFVGREADLDRDHLPPDTVEVDARGSAVLPGFVDSHTHIAWLGERSAEYAQRAAGDTYADIAAAGSGIKATVRATATGRTGQSNGAPSGTAMQGGRLCRRTAGV